MQDLLPSQLDLDLFLRIFFAAILGAIVGVERELRQRPAGLRTFMLVSVGSAMFTVLSIYGFRGLVEGNIDPARVAAQILTGVGFIGGGMILRQQNQVYGITTAAGIWAVAGIGMACGVGFYWVAALTTILVTIILWALRAVERDSAGGA
jgi:putative Mg2+ transporter-C (MgtC) family protein